MKYYFLAFYNYADFRGRARRKEFWMFSLFHILVSCLASYLDVLMGTSIITYGPGISSLVYFAIIIIPCFSITVRRLHDTGNSGWMTFINLIPVIGNIWFFILIISGGHRRRNKYGENPRKMKFDYEFQ